MMADCDEFGCFLVGAIIGLSIGFLLGTMISSAANSERTAKMLNSVGIERIEKCHNVHSNWSEIVWMKDTEQQ